VAAAAATKEESKEALIKAEEQLKVRRWILTEFCAWLAWC
jgi:hypothetical protein